MIKAGDVVRFLNAVGGGVVSKVKDGLVYVEDEDGFETPVQARECVVVAGGKPKATAYDRPIVAAPSKLAVDEKPAAVASVAPVVVAETEEGDMMNVVLAYVPDSVRNLNSTKFTAYLVNDSNYYLYFTYLIKGDGDDWSVRYSGIVEPNIQVLLETFSHELLADMGRIAVQYVAFKKDKGFKLKNPVSVEHKIDGTKFYKLHTFAENEYFDEPVLAFEIVKNDVPYRSYEVNSNVLREAMMDKKSAEMPRHTPVRKHEKVKSSTLLECDLHIDALLDDKTGLSNSDMLNVQLDKFREVMNENVKHNGRKVVFIHGKGDGVLRKAILDELKKKYHHCLSQDASFKEYGFGATLITMHP